MQGTRQESLFRKLDLEGSHSPAPCCKKRQKKRLSNCRNQIGENVAVSITEKCIKKKNKTKPHTDQEDMGN